MSEDKKIPKFEIKDDVLTITISADDLKFITEGRLDCGYIVKDKSLLLKDFTKQLDGQWCGQNAQELGITEFQHFIDKAIDQVYQDASESIDVKEEYQ